MCLSYVHIEFISIFFFSVLIFLKNSSARHDRKSPGAYSHGCERRPCQGKVACSFHGSTHTHTHTHSLSLSLSLSHIYSCSDKSQSTATQVTMVSGCEASPLADWSEKSIGFNALQKSVRQVGVPKKNYQKNNKKNLGAGGDLFLLSVCSPNC